MIAIAYCESYKDAASAFKEGFKWCYLGKKTDMRDRISVSLGDDNRFFLGGRLHKIADEIRTPFLDFIASLGKDQPDKFNWWASTFSSKSPYQTDFLLLICYYKLVHELASEFKKKPEPLLIIVEDPWLLKMLKENSDLSSLPFFGRPSLWTDRLSSLLRGVAYRLLLLIYVMALKSLLIIYRRRNKPVEGVPDSVSVLSYIEERAFDKITGIYKDPYTGDIEEKLKSMGFKVIRPTFLVFPLSLSKSVAMNMDRLWPIVLDLGLMHALKSVISFWRPEIRNSPLISGINPKTLLNREFWKEFAITSFNSNMMYYFAMKGFADRRWTKTLIYPFENLSFEKMLCLGAKEAGGIRLLGYRDTPTPWFYLSAFMGKGEKDFAPLPDKILTIGRFTFDMFSRHGNYPEGILAIGGALKYEHLLKEETQTKATPMEKTVLIATPIDPFISKTLILDIGREFRENTEGIRFLIKCHPSTPFSSLNISVDEGLFTITDRPVSELLNIVDTMIYSDSTVGLEFLVRGKSVVRYVSENLINMDILVGVDKEMFISCYESGAREAILKALSVNHDAERLERASRVKAEYFSPVDYGMFEREIKGE